MAMPLSVPIKRLSSPDVTTAPMRVSPSSMDSAMIPEGRGFEKASSRVFLTMPRLVASSTWCPEEKSRTEQKAAIFSPDCNETRLTTGLPFAWRVTSGMAWTFSQ